jgi:hypothetical protein
MRRFVLRIFGPKNEDAIGEWKKYINMGVYFVAFT